MEELKAEDVSGFVAGIYFWPQDPLSIVTVPNIKTKTEVLKLLAEENHRFSPERVEEVKNCKRIPWDVIKWARWVWSNAGIRTPKPDKYGLLGGNIEEFDIVTATKAGHQLEYPDYAFARECVEESGLVSVREEKGIRRPLFERVVQFWEDDYRNSEKEHEDHFFWLREADGVLNTRGVEEETDPPEIISLMSLYPGYDKNYTEDKKVFYPKHAKAVIVLLNRFVQEGKKEYKEPLAYLRETFNRPDKNRFRREPRMIMPERIPNMNLSDDELFKYYTTGTKSL